MFAASWNVSGQPVYLAVPRSLVLVFWAFTGLESAAVAVEVVENPQRNLPLAALGGVVLAAVIYVVSCTVLMGIVPAKELADSSAPFALVARQIFGPTAATVLIFTTILKASGHPWRVDACVGRDRESSRRGRGFPRPVRHGSTGAVFRCAAC